jgi:hypothetical protein
MTNASNGKVGYNIIDLETGIPAGLVSAIRDLPNVLRVRALSFA